MHKTCNGDGQTNMYVTCPLGISFVSSVSVQCQFCQFSVSSVLVQCQLTFFTNNDLFDENDFHSAENVLSITISSVSVKC